MVEYITELVGFAVVLFVLGKWLLPVINKAMTQRQEVIRKQLDEAEEAKRRLATARKEYERALDEARQEGERLQESAKEQAEAIQVEMREQAEAEARRIVEQAHQQIEADHQQALNELQNTVGRLTAGLAERIVGASLQDDARQERVIDRFLDELEQRARRTSDDAEDGASPARRTGKRKQPSAGRVTRGSDS
jgi:F-type H+-transporting ATPase subunit b